MVVDQARGAGNGCFLFDEVREVEFEMGRISFESFLQGEKNGMNIFYVDEAIVLLEDLEEAAHVGTFELVGEINGKGDGGHGILGGVSSVANHDWVAKTFDADFIDSEVPIVRGGLNIMENGGAGGSGGLLFQGTKILP